MNIEDILNLGNYTAIITELSKDKVTVQNGYPEDRNYQKIRKWQKYFNGDHPILVNPERANYTTEGGKYTTRARIVLNYPQQIIKTATAMVLGEPADLVLNSTKDAKESERFAMFDKVWKQYAGMDSFNMELLSQLMIESKIVEKLYFKGGVLEPENIRSMRMSAKDGDEIYAHYSEEGDIDAIVRKYSITEVENGTFVNKSRTDIYTQSKEITLDENDNLISETGRTNEYNYAIYYDQFINEWHNVSGLIDAQELIASQTRDVNKRVGNPSIVAKGSVKAMPDPNEDVKVFQMDAVGSPETGFTYGDVSFLESEGAREAVDRETQKFDNYIYKFTWPDLSFLLRELKTGNLSGTAIKLMFTDALASVALKKAVIDKGFQQKIDVIKEMLFVCTRDSGYLDLDITLSFNSILPDNITETIQQLQDSVNAHTTSQKQATYKNPINKGAEEEVWEEIQVEESKGSRELL